MVALLFPNKMGKGEIEDFEKVDFLGLNFRLFSTFWGVAKGRK